MLFKEKSYYIVTIGIDEQTKQKEEAYRLGYLQEVFAGIAAGYHLK